MLYGKCIKQTSTLQQIYDDWETANLFGLIIMLKFLTSHSRIDLPADTPVSNYLRYSLIHLIDTSNVSDVTISTTGSND